MNRMIDSRNPSIASLHFSNTHVTRISSRRDGAGDGIRTRDINLGKVALYQLSYSRVATASLRSRLGNRILLSRAKRETVKCRPPTRAEGRKPRADQCLSNRHIVIES